ncbi:unnamed protein product [Moneuplotes crassus]|uniref:Secreted protein n=1 Tax=Euplotes crassus TaxID=5936 RepID=A0AAD1XSX0_EUPCR|nr:unnamed protein product [Moneuplotes crassus]
MVHLKGFLRVCILACLIKLFCCLNSPSIHITTHEDLFILTSSFISDSSNLMRELIHFIHIFLQRTFIRTIKMILHFRWGCRKICAAGKPLSQLIKSKPLILF